MFNQIKSELKENIYKIIKGDTVNLKRLKYVMDLYDKPIDLEEIQKYYKLV